MGEVRLNSLAKGSAKRYTQEKRDRLIELICIEFSVSPNALKYSNKTTEIVNARIAFLVASSYCGFTIDESVEAISMKLDIAKSVLIVYSDIGNFNSIMSRKITSVVGLYIAESSGILWNYSSDKYVFEFNDNTYSILNVSSVYFGKAFIAIKNNEYLWHSDNYSQLRVKLLKLAINDKRELC